MAASSSDDSSDDICVVIRFVFFGLCDGLDVFFAGLASSSELESTAARSALTLDRGVSGVPDGEATPLPAGEEDLEEAIDVSIGDKNGC
jgi:hypothetical protein